MNMTQFASGATAELIGLMLIISVPAYAADLAGQSVTVQYEDYEPEPVRAARQFYVRGDVGLARNELGGVAQALRQETALAAAFADVFRIETLAIYGVVVLLLKCLHELGHALTTLHYGCRVPSMGVAFMLGAPVLYTDTSDSWRLSRRSQRWPAPLIRSHV